MNKVEFLKNIGKDIEELLLSQKLTNHKNQAFAWRLNAHFERTFDEQYLWTQALYLSTNCCLLLQDNKYNKLAIRGLSESGEIYESLGKLNNNKNEYDKEYFLILSALCYDLSGYQANAYCIASSVKDFILTTPDKEIDLSVDNFIIYQISLILTKLIPLAKSRLESENHIENLGYNLFKSSLLKWYDYILKQKQTDYLSDIKKTYIYYLSKGNVYISHLLFLLEQRILLFNDRGIWNVLSKIDEIKNNYQWKKYTRLLAFDYYKNTKVKELMERCSIFEFWTSQLRAFEKGILDSDDNFVVQMPTSTGKTFIAELMILKNLIKYPDKKCLYIAPFRALNNEKEVELGKYLSKLGYSVSSLSGAYEIDAFQDVVISESDLLIATPEKMDFLLRIQPEIFNNISFVVIDEGHIIGDISFRATLLEFLIIRLRIKIKDLKTLFISAVMPIENANDYSVWLNGEKSKVLRSLKFQDSNEEDEWEPTRKLISSFEWSSTAGNGNIFYKDVEIFDTEKNLPRQGAFLYSFIKENEFGNKFPKKSQKKEVSATLAYKLSEGGTTLVFCGTVTRGGIDSVAKSMIDLLSLIDVPERFKSNKNKKSFFYSEKWYGEGYITNAIEHGIGVHFGDMPEQVRIAVEDDFREGLLCVLLCTNTIGQGLNFPIKNIIFHKIQIGGPRDCIQYRDFWNIIGRAGRAGKETEGNIVFVIQTYTDRNLYNDFTDKRNIEPAVSLIFKVLNRLFHERLSLEAQEDFSDDISLLSETYLLDLITEEIIGTDYEEIIEKIINNSLFKVQIDKNNLDIKLIKDEFRKIFRSFESSATHEQLSIYKKTGLSLKSNQVINSFVETNLSILNECIEKDDFQKIIELFLRMLSDYEIPEMMNDKLKRLGISTISFFPVVINWIKGEPIDKLFEIWQKTTTLKVDKFHIFIANGLFYLYPWGISSFLIHLSYKTGIELNNLPENIKNTPSYIKYGLDNQISCLARTLGIKSRETAMSLHEVSNGLQGTNFIKWINNLTNDEIKTFNIPRFEQDNVREISLKLTSNKPNIMGQRYTFYLKGTVYNTEWKHNSNLISINDILEYSRYYDNTYDPYAIILKKDLLEIGYIPREYSKIISSEIDISDKKYTAKVINLIKKDDYNEIEVLLEENMFSYFENIETLTV